MTKDIVYELLEEVKDPEIPVLSLVDLGVITGVNIDVDQVTIEMTNGVEKVKIEVSYKKPWNSDLITEKGKQALKKFGLAPPPSRKLFQDLDVLEHASCPRCGQNNTELRNTFGPTLCRSIHYCNDCMEAFEQFKPL